MLRKGRNSGCKGTYNNLITQETLRKYRQIELKKLILAY